MNVVVVRRGVFSHARVAWVDAQEGSVPCLRLLTGVGDIVADERAVFLTRSGPLPAAALASAAMAGRPPRLELARPTAKARATSALVTTALGSLITPPRAVHFPSHLRRSLSDDLVGAYEALGAQAVARYTDDRWTILRGDPSGITPPPDDVDATLLLRALAWAELASGLESRVILDDHETRRALFMALVRDNLPFGVRWVPSYRPIEARIALLNPSSWPVFVSVVGARATAQRMLTLAIYGEPAAVMVGLALIAPP